MKMLRKTTAVLLILAIFVALLPHMGKTAEAFDPDNFYVESVTVGKTYDRNRIFQKAYITIIGKYLKDAEVGIITYSEGYVPLTNRTVNSFGILQFELTEEQLGKELYIEGIAIPINEGEMPALTGVNRSLEMGQDNLGLLGTKLDKIDDDTNYDDEDPVKALFGKGNSYTNINKFNITNKTTAALTVETPVGELGLQDIVFNKTTMTDPIEFNQNHTNQVEIQINYTYKNQFRFFEKLPISDDLEMFPNRGQKGDTVFFRATQLDEYDVFFLKSLDGTDPYTIYNRGQNPTYKANVEGDKDVLTVQVPDLATGEYYVVLTNKISEGKDPMEAVTGEWIVRVDNSDSGSAPETFMVIDASQKARILDVQPDIGPDSGSAVKIYGQFIGSLNIAEFTPDDPDQEPTISTESTDNTLVVEYVYGDYKGMRAYAKRYIKVFIGNQAAFNKNASGEYDASFSKDLDRINIQTSQVTDADEDPVKDVVIETETVFELENGENIVIKERTVKQDGFTYYLSKIKPQVDRVVPDKIQVGEAETGYVVDNEFMIAVHGSDLMIHKYTDPNTGEEIVRYPVIRLGNEIVLDKNQNPDLKVYVLDDNGNILDGSQGNELGTKIIAYIPEGQGVSNLGKTFVEVINPVRNSQSMGLSDIKYDIIEFVKVTEEKLPIISKVEPNVIATDSQEQIVIEGSNFREGVKVFIDGEEVTPIDRQEDGKKITFQAPIGREGETRLQVMNPEGGIASWPFIYVKTYTNPGITDFSPKSGNTGTLVLIKGENFLQPDPTVSPDDILYKLVGTRVLLEGKDINQYNVNTETKKIELIDYESPDEDRLIRVEENEYGTKVVKLANYYYSVVLQEIDTASGQLKDHFYVIQVDKLGRPVITDGINSIYTIELGTGDTLKANREGGSAYDLTVDRDKITIHEDPHIELKLRTLYKVEQDEQGNSIIVGNNVKVVNRTTIYFTVPILEADGWYDVTVINPDTKRDSRLNHEGFYYYRQPQSRPVITEVIPNQGSTEGGYTIDIYGQEFQDNGVEKSRVYINGVEVAEEDTTVSPDGTRITVKVPPYPGDLREEPEADRLTVPIVIVNPDGASASKEDGFTYVVPTSYPKITNIIPNRGNAAGGEVIEIIGSDFRYFEPYNDANRNQVKDDNETFLDMNGNGIWDSEANVDEWKDPQPLDHKQYDKYFASPILPKVYFGSKQAKIVEFSRGYIKVISPSAESGETVVCLVNNDSGVSNTVAFTYEASTPEIYSIVPDKGKKQGRDVVEIHGKDFMESEIQVYGVDEVSGELVPETTRMVTVRFGSITNTDIPRQEPNSGRIDNGRATVNLPGGLRVEYDANKGEIDLLVETGDEIYSETFPYDYTDSEDSVRYIPLWLLKNDDGESYNSGYEMVRIEVKDRRLLVERGFAPDVDYITSEQLYVYTPSYYTIGVVEVRVINPDGGVAVGQFEYKNPDSSPSIINITKEGNSPVVENIIGYGDVKVLRMTYKGGNIVSVIGADFRERAEIKIGDFVTVKLEDITYSLPTKLTFKMPPVPEEEVGKLHRVMVINEDGGVAASDQAQPVPIYIMFTKGETAPAIETITPDRGPSSGGTRIKIEGKDFREGLTVYFGEVEVPQEDITVVDYKTIYVTTPPHEPGEVEVKVENPDGALSEPTGSFLYLSSPQISAVVDPRDPTETTRLYQISVKGGQEIKLKGSGFVEGARVVFSPVVAGLGAEKDAQGDVIYILGEPYELREGREGIDVKFIDSETLVLKTPGGKLGKKGVMVINPDGGASKIYENLAYGLPELAQPTGVRAELVYDRYIKVTWIGVTGAIEYEVYALVEDRLEFVGSTQFESFVYDDLEPRTRYSFVVKAIGEYGASKPSERSNTVKTGRRVGPPDDDGGIIEKTRMNKTGQTADIIIGEDDYDDKEIKVDLTRGELAGSKEAVVSIPASVVVKNDAKDITIIGKDFVVKFNPRVFRTSTINRYKSREDAGIKFKVAPYYGSHTANLTKTPQTLLSNQYIVQAYFFIGKEFTSLDYLTGNIQITIDFDVDKANLRRLRNISLNRYDDYSDLWQSIAYPQGDYNTSITAWVNRLGKFAVLGSRR